MFVRPAIAILLALAILLPRVAGLHFHELDHQPEAVSSSALQHDFGAHAYSDFEHDHLLEHAEGAEDVDDGAVSGAPRAKVPNAPLVAAHFLPLLPTLDGLLRAVVLRPPLRPPRYKDAEYRLPPSQGPPLAT